MTVKNLKRKGRQGPAPVHEDTGPLLRFRSQQEIQRSVTFLVASLTLSIAGIIGLRVLGDKFMPQGGMPLAAVTTYDPATERMSLQHGWVAPSVNSTYGTDSLDFSPVDDRANPTGVSWLDTRPGFSSLELNVTAPAVALTPVQRAAYSFILHHEGPIPKTYYCRKGAHTIGAGLNMEANPELLCDVFGIDFGLACAIADGQHTAKLDGLGIERLLEYTLLKKEKIARQKLDNRGFNFDGLEPLAQAVVLDLCYHRPNFLDNKQFLNNLQRRDFRAAAKQLLTEFNKDRYDPNLAGLAMRNAARAYILCPELFNGKNPQKSPSANENRAWLAIPKQGALFKSMVADLPPLSSPAQPPKRNARQR